MIIELYDIQFDNVIESYYITVCVEYKFAVERLVPLINKLDFQRNPLRASFYKRLEEDLKKGCIMPNITIAIKVDGSLPLKEEISEIYIDNNLNNAFILDGIQRLSTLNRVANNNGDFDLNRKLYCNILISNSMDRLLYRMITLNNGQKPMSARHQVEILAGKIFDFENLAILGITEKDLKKKARKSEEMMNKENLIKGYLSYISASVNIDNQKIIEEKMNELIADKILNSNVYSKEGEFKDIVDFISKMLGNEYLSDWFKVANNFIGFSAAMNQSFNYVKNFDVIKMETSINLFEDVFMAIDVSKIKLGMVRRRMVKYYFENIKEFENYTYSDLLDAISLEL